MADEPGGVDAGQIHAGSRRKIVFDSTFGIMDGVTNYYYQPGTLETDIRVEDTGRSEAFVAAERHEEAPNYRAQFDNVVSYTTTAWGGDHLVKVGAQFAQMGMNDQFWVNGDMHILFNNGAANAVRLWNTPTAHNSKIRLFGIFAQDTWSYKKLTLNLGVRVDHSRGWMPEQSKAAGTFIGRARSRRDRRVQLLARRVAYRASSTISSGRAGPRSRRARAAMRRRSASTWCSACIRSSARAARGRGRIATAIASRRRASSVPSAGSPDRAAAMPMRNGPDWPYSDEFTAGFEHQLAGDVRVGATYYYRTNR